MTRAARESASTPVPQPVCEVVRAILPEFGRPTHVITLKEIPESGVFRLVGARPQYQTVIAKHCKRPSAAVERAVYEQILPRIPVSYPAYYGSWIDPTDGSIWILLEDAGDSVLSRDDPVHQDLAAQWLGALHTSSAHLVANFSLPDRSPPYYRGVLHTARATILGGLANPALQADEPAVLRRVVEHLDLLDSRWNQLVAVCQAVPQTLVHGDFVDKNVRVHNGSTGWVLLPFDWESAGWGVPAVDLDRVSVGAYHRTIQGMWPHVAMDTVQQLVGIARLFRLLKLIDWASEKLVYSWVEKTINNEMRFYCTWLEEAMRVVRWRPAGV